MPKENTRTEAALKDDVINLLSWAHETYSFHVALTCSFGGIGGIVLAHIVASHGFPFTILFTDTDFLFLETYDLKKQLENEWGLNVRTVKSHLSPAAQEKQYGEALWNHNPDLCCSIRKVDPMAGALQDYSCWITGIRRDQGPSRKHVQPVETHVLPGGHRLAKLNPLAAWSKNDVWRYVERHHIPYNPLLDSGYRSIGCIQCTSPSSDDNERSGRWLGKGKSECGLHTFTEKQR